MRFAGRQALCHAGRKVTTPLQRSEFALSEARRFAFLICVILAIASYLFFEENTRRLRVLDIVLYDHVLASIDAFNRSPISSDYVTSIHLVDSYSDIVESIDMKGAITIAPIRSVSSFSVSCHVYVYRLSLKESPIAIEGLGPLRLAPTGNSHTLLSFPADCNIFNRNAPIYALVGDFYIPGYAEDPTMGAIYEDGTGDIHFAAHTALLDYVLRSTQRVTGKYYRKEEYRDAISRLLEISENAPVVLGMSFPAQLTALLLPLSLTLVSFAFYHRVRRIGNKGEAAWVMLHRVGTLEKLVSGLWMVALIMSSVAVYVTANTYLQAGVEFVDRRPGYSVLISRAPWSDAWIAVHSAAMLDRWYIRFLD